MVFWLASCEADVVKQPMAGLAGRGRFSGESPGENAKSAKGRRTRREPGREEEWEEWGVWEEDGGATQDRRAPDLAGISSWMLTPDAERGILMSDRLTLI